MPLPFLIAQTPATLAGQWTLVYRRGEGNSWLTLRSDGSFIQITPNQSKPSPPIRGTFVVRHLKQAALIEFRVTPTPSHLPQPWGRPVFLASPVRYVPEVPALVLSDQWAYVPKNDVISARHRLALWRKASR